jgi:hypothetical protein
MNGKIIKNYKLFCYILANIINLCFALADDNGNWIIQNRVGDPMLREKNKLSFITVKRNSAKSTPRTSAELFLMEESILLFMLNLRLQYMIG